MEPMPILPPPQSAERAPERPVSAGNLQTSVEITPDTHVESGRESAAQTPLSPPPVNPVITPVQTPQASQTTDPASAPTSTNPSIADDVDVIEKEWVERAKKIVEATKNDPRLQEQEVSKMQADYLMKRYGKKMKLAE